MSGTLGLVTQQIPVSSIRLGEFPVITQVLLQEILQSQLFLAHLGGKYNVLAEVGPLFV